MSFFYFNWSTNSRFGAGVDVVSGTTMSTNAFQDPLSVALDEQDNKDSEAHNVFVEDTSTYTSTVDEAVSASASAWGGSASGSAEYISDASGYSYSLRLMGYDHIEFNKHLANLDGLEMSMSDLAKKLLDASSPDDFDPQSFFDTYGLYFISGYIKGGTIIADYTLKFTSQSEMDSLTADVKASYSDAGFSADMDASISKLSTSSSSSFSTETYCRIYGGTNAGEVVVNSCEGIGEAIESFADELGDGDELYAIVQAWTDIPWVAEQLKSWDVDLESLLYRDDQEDSLAALSTEYLNQLVIENTAEQIINNREYTFQSRLDILDAVVSDCQNGTAAIEDFIKDPSQIPTNASKIPSDLMVSDSIYDKLNSYLSIDYYTIAITYHLNGDAFNPTSGDSTVTIPISTVNKGDKTYLRLLETDWTTHTGKGWRLAIRAYDGQLRAEFKEIDNDNWNAYGAAIIPGDCTPGSLQSSESKAWPAYINGAELTSSDEKYKDHYFTIVVV